MAKLSDLLSSREITAYQENLPKGKIFTATGLGGMYSCIRTDMQWCWNSPGCGIAVIEVWGAAGSASCNCCCGVGLPGNTGAYLKKTIAVTPCSFVAGRPGVPCNGNSNFSFTGCSESSCFVWSDARDLCGNTNGCLCAQGGAAGKSCCFDGGSPFCAFYCTGYCGTLIVNGANVCCGIICNRCPGLMVACAWGGDNNCCGIDGKMEFRGCQHMCTCQFIEYVPYSPAIFAEEGGYLVFPVENDHGDSNWAGAGMGAAGHVLNSSSKSPSGGKPWSACWRGDRFCTCYEHHACMNYMPYGVAASAATVCPGVRDVGRRGGAGAIRITYRGTNPNGEVPKKLGGSL